MPVWRCGLLCVHLQTGHEVELRREYEHLAADSFGTLPRDNLWLPAVAFLAEACAHLGHRQGARTLESLLAPYAGRNVVTPDVAYVGPWTATSRCRRHGRRSRAGRHVVRLGVGARPENERRPDVRAARAR